MPNPKPIEGITVENPMLNPLPGEPVVPDKGEPPETDHHEDEIADSIAAEETLREGVVRLAKQLTEVKVEFEKSRIVVMQATSALQQANELLRIATYRCRIMREGFNQIVTHMAAMHNVLNQMNDYTPSPETPKDDTARKQADGTPRTSSRKS